MATASEANSLYAQGPFPRSEILAWFDEQYFNDKLRIRPANPKDGPFRELSMMLKAWGHVQKKDDTEQVNMCFHQSATPRFICLLTGVQRAQHMHFLHVLDVQGLQCLPQQSHCLPVYASKGIWSSPE